MSNACYDWCEKEAITRCSTCNKSENLHTKEYQSLPYLNNEECMPAYRHTLWKNKWTVILNRFICVIFIEFECLSFLRGLVLSRLFKSAGVSIQQTISINNIWLRSFLVFAHNFSPVDVSVYFNSLIYSIVQKDVKFKIVGDFPNSCDAGNWK